MQKFARTAEISTKIAGATFYVRPLHNFDHKWIKGSRRFRGLPVPMHPLTIFNKILQTTTELLVMQPSVSAGFSEWQYCPSLVLTGGRTELIQI